MGMDMDMDTSYSRTYYIGTYHDHGTGGLFNKPEDIREYWTTLGSTE